MIMKNSKFRAVIFDMDGVVVDSEHLHYEADSRIFAHFGIRVPAEERLQFVGMSVQKFYTTVCTQYAPHLLPDFMIELDRRYRVCFFRHSELKANAYVYELLDCLKKKKISTALASGSSPELIDTILEKLHLKGFFDVVLSSEKVPRPKPWPDVFLRAAEFMNVLPGECIVIEDSFLGIEAARAAGMFSIGYAGKNGSSQDLSGANRIITSFRHLCQEWEKWLELANKSK
jgi:HAD superfamily hydrolase (TIGR01509 family)